jgi:hypothetical protein
MRAIVDLGSGEVSLGRITPATRDAVQEWLADRAVLTGCLEAWQARHSRASVEIVSV